MIRRCWALLPPLLVWAAAVPAASDFYVPGSESDPMVRASDFDAANGQYLSATSLLLQVQQAAGDKPLNWEFTRRLADDSLGFGMQQRAESLYKGRVEKDKDSEDLGRARLKLSEFLYNFGFNSEADVALQALKEQLPQKVLIDWQDVYSRNLMAEGQFADSAEVLTKPDNVKSQKAYMRYNLGVALIKEGHADQGLTELDRVTELPVRDEDDLALRDKALLSLGYYFLRQKQGGSAIPEFSRVRSEGPYSNRALLGLGWAYLAPQGARQKRAIVGDEEEAQFSVSTIGSIFRPGFLDADIYKRAGLRPFHIDRVDPTEEADLKRALVPWVELIGRDPMDPAVQEGLLAIPFALDRLGAHIEAKDYYEKALAALQDTRAQIDVAIANVKTGQLIREFVRGGVASEAGFSWKLKDLPNLPEMYYLRRLMADNRFTTALYDYRDVGLLIADIDTQRARIADLQSAYATRASQSSPDAKVDEHVADVAQKFSPYKVDSVPAMQLEGQISAQSDSATPVPGGDNPPVALHLNDAPGQFQGSYESMESLKSRLDVLEPKLKAAQAASTKLLIGMELKDLQAQRKLNEKYLIEARFSLARIYDRQQHGDAP